MQVACWLLSRGLGRRLEPSVVALGLLLPLLVLAPWLATPRLLFPGDFLRNAIPGAPDKPGSDRHMLLNDVVLQLVPWELEIRHALKDGRLPFWSDLLEGGSSPWVNPQAGVLSPIALAARWVPIPYWLLVMLALKIQLAVEGAWLLARCAAVSRRGSLLAALGFSLSGGVMPWALFPITATVVWVPWLTAGVILLFRERLSARRVATVGVLLAALLLSGHPETAAIGGLLAAVCGLCLRSRRISLPRGLARAVSAMLLGTGLAALHILPFLLHLPESQRAGEMLALEMPVFHAVVWHPLTWFVGRSLPFLWSPASPHAFGRPYQDAFTGPFDWADACSGYAGLVAFAGSAVAAAGIRRRRAALPFLAFAAVGLLSAAEFIPFVILEHSVKVLQALHYQRFLPVCALALCIAGGHGIDLWLRRRSRWGLAALPLVAALSLAVRADSQVVSLWLLIGGAAAVAFWRPRWSAALLVLALLLDLVPWAWSQLPSGNPAFFYPPSPLLARLRQEVSTGDAWRSVGESYAVYPSILPVYGIADVRPHNPLAPKAYLLALDAAFGFRPSMANYFSAFRNPGHPFLDFLNVRCVVWQSPSPVPARFERIDAGVDPAWRLYRNPAALPRWFVPSRIDPVAPGDLAGWIAGLDDGRRVAVLRQPGIPELPRTPAPADIQVLRDEPGNVLLRVTAKRRTVIATSLQEVQGWSVRRGGRELTKLTVDGSFLGFRVPRGESLVELRFVPPGFAVGLTLSALSLLICGALYFSRSRKNATVRGQASFAAFRLAPLRSSWARRKP
jgi:hypothetical protein